MPDLTAAAEGIGHMLSDRLLAVPNYQRPFSWGEAEVVELWDDLEAAIERGDAEYFLGATVTSKNGDRFNVIDGQQRLASVSLLIAAMRDIFAANADERAGEIQSSVLGTKDIVTRALTQFLKLNAEDNDVFRQLTLVPAAERALTLTSDSHQRIVAAFQFFRDKLDALIDGRGADWQTPLLRWYTFLMDNAKIVDVSATEENRAFVIFETLNDRGLNLRTIDLLKNHLFGTANGRLEEAQTYWQQATAILRAGGTADDEVDRFLRQYWASQKGLVRVKALFSQIKPTVTTADQAVSFARELAEAAPQWLATADVDSDIWQDHPTSAAANIAALKSFNAEAYRPLLLAVLRTFTGNDVDELLQSIVRWMVRLMVSGNAGGGTAEKAWAESAKGVTDGTLATVEDVQTFMGAKVPGDAEFQAAFTDARITNGKFARYLLAELERTHREANGLPTDVVPDPDPSSVNLEHVLPKRPTAAEWGQFSPDERRELTLNMGNQALLLKEHNRIIGNKPFATKQPILADSSLALTAELGAKLDWAPADVRARARALAELAVATW